MSPWAMMTDAWTPVMVLEGLRAATVVGMLGAAAVLDLKHRRVPNRFWLPFVAVAALALAVDAWLHRAGGLQTVLLDDAVAAALCGFFYVLWRFGMFGGADAKGLMVVAILMPRLPAAAVPVPAALGILALGSLLAALLPVALLAWNGAHGKWRMPTAFVGIWLPIARARSAKVWPMEEQEHAVDPEGATSTGAVDAAQVFRIRHDMRLQADRKERSERRLAALEAAGRTHAWFAPQVPLLAFLFPGAILWLWVRTILAAALTA